MDLTVPFHGLLSRHFVIDRSFGLEFASGGSGRWSSAGYYYWELISLRVFGMVFDDALDGSEMMLLEGVVGETAVE